MGLPAFNKFFGQSGHGPQHRNGDHDPDEKRYYVKMQLIF